MAKLKDIKTFLNHELDPFLLDDSSHNGLQVESSRPIKKIGFAVDACIETFHKAINEGCDMIIVHHGLFWNKKETITGNLYQRLKLLLDNELALYASHLPLDKHPTYGNNAQLFKLLGVRPTKDFGKVGYQGAFPKPKLLKSIVTLLNSKLGAKCAILNYGKQSIKTVAIESGDGEFDAFEAIRKDIDLYITGEIGHSIYHPVREAGINIIGAGHYATETMGVKALMPVLKKRFNVKVVFLDSPTGL